MYIIFINFTYIIDRILYNYLLILKLQTTLGKKHCFIKHRPYIRLGKFSHKGGLTMCYVRVFGGAPRTAGVSRLKERLYRKG